MKSQIVVLLGFLFFAAPSWADLPETPPASVLAPEGSKTEMAGTNQSQTSDIPPSPNESSRVFQQIVSLSAGPYSPHSVVVSNGTYSFNYNNGSTQSFMIEAGWAIRVLGGFYVSENLNYSRLSGSPASGDSDIPTSSTLSVSFVGIDTRLNYSWETSPIRWIIPFVEGGYQYTFYSQGGTSDLDSVEGGVGNFVGGAGARIWVNKSVATTPDEAGIYRTIPIFLTLKWNRIFQNGSSVDLSDNTFLAGVSVGL